MHCGNSSPGEVSLDTQKQNLWMNRSKSAGLPLVPQQQGFILLPGMVRPQRASYEPEMVLLRIFCDAGHLHTHTTLACVCLHASGYTHLQDPLSSELGLKSQEMAKDPF